VISWPIKNKLERRKSMGLSPMRASNDALHRFG
jgi:hypothetical protein